MIARQAAGYWIMPLVALAACSAASQDAVTNPALAYATRDALPGIPEGDELVELIPDSGFERSIAGFGAIGTNLPADITQTTVAPIDGDYSLHVVVESYGRIGMIHEYGYGSGPFADSLTATARVRVETASSVDRQLQICAIAYLQTTNVPLTSCQDLPVDAGNVADVYASIDIAGQQLSRAFFQLALNDSGSVTATLDDAHLYVVQPIAPGSPGCLADEWGCGDFTSCTAEGTQTRSCTLTFDCPDAVTPSPPTSQPCTPPSGGTRQYPSRAGGRHVTMMAPTDGEVFWTPSAFRFVAQGFDINVFTNVPTPGHGQNSDRVEFYIDDTLVGSENGGDAEYSIFKTMVGDVALAPGTHQAWARAFYANPSLILDSEPVLVTVQRPPEYARTIDLTDDVVLTGGQAFELVGTPSGRIRLNGNGFTIRAADGASNLTLRHVDVHDLGSRTSTGSPGLDIVTTGAVVVEDSTFDSTNPVVLQLNGSAAASVRDNLFRSNTRNPIGQQPNAPDTFQVIVISGNSTAPKVFAGNTIAAGPVGFTNASRWTIGGSTDADSNVLIGPRVGFEIASCTEMTISGNVLLSSYLGGWSQGQLLELFGSTATTVEHNVLFGSSWPVRGVAGEFRYNLVLKAGHEWLWPAEHAHIHHNVFVGGDNDVGGIASFYAAGDIRIENNTFDAQSGSLVRAMIDWENGTTTLRSNAFLNVPITSAAPATVVISAGSVDADYNAFCNQQPTNYSDHRTPPHDLPGGTPLGCRLAGPVPSVPFDLSATAVWTRQLPVSAILSNYRARYSPDADSPLIDAGDPAGGTGNDVGAIGAGTHDALDRFGSFGQPAD